ncbi:hypothetical protein [Flavobacterium sp. HSC-61S13]|uniref:hypothetical protein n=1 Tax=Flavobacterium sp. HSC-61S13 TaxID=2910963 RepID=UPI00209FC700|nr:hypothetical protein [Flavobacterium sp. HSC-61S13]MCP1996227.1 hypothetical protein [Flavobacterium sp. HSC-61S13]
MKNTLVMFCFFLHLGIGFSQEIAQNLTIDQVVSNDNVAKWEVNPVFYGEIFGSVMGKDFEKESLGGGLNYQVKSHLFSIQYIASSVKDQAYAYIPLESMTIHDHNILYGQRFIFGTLSLSFSAGVSYSNIIRKITENYAHDAPYIKNDNYWGIPYELNIKWFKSVKRPLLPARLLSMSKPTAFGTSFGFKFHGSISQQNYVGVGMVIGMGWHRPYEN